MKLQIKNLIIGAGASGLIINDILPSDETIIIERGYSHGKTGDYVVFLKKESPITLPPITVNTINISSGCAPFDIEYTEKVYNKIIDIKQFTDIEEQAYSISKGYPLDLPYLLKHANIYGNIEATSIDLDAHILHGKILHLNKDVQIEYGTLISTIPIYEFTKLAGVNLLKHHDIFISYFPIGIKRSTLLEPVDEMTILYLSDKNVPYYRKQSFGKTLYYEYCINKPYKEKFDTVIIPGKFTKQNMNKFYEFLESYDVYLVGRFATWDPDFLLDHITIADTNIMSSLHVTRLLKDSQ